MKVTLLEAGSLDILLFTKQTRLEPSPELLEEIRAWPPERKQEELDYMRGTIQSSWEFIHYTFLLQDVSRAFTHQFVRTRTQSYAQESQRAVDKSGFGYLTPGGLADPETQIGYIWVTTMKQIDQAYQDLVHLGTPNGEARGLLPTNVLTNIVVKTDLRTLYNTALIRLCYRTQGEYQNVFRAMREEVLKVHPWAEPFIRVHCAAVGTCAFPHFKECPIKGGVYNPDTGRRWDHDFNDVANMEHPVRPSTRDEQQAIWQSAPPFEADPSRRGLPPGAVRRSADGVARDKWDYGVEEAK